MSYFPQVPITFADSTAVDAFGRLRVSNPEGLFNGKIIGADNTLRWADAQTSGAGTGSSYDANASTVTLSVGNTTAGTRTRSSKQYYNYHAGRSQFVLVTGVLGSGASGIRRRMGYFNDDNGMYVQLDGTALSFVLRSKSSGAVVNTSIAQASWNVDTMDGAGPSGITLDTSKAQIFFVDFEWLGVGRVRYGFVIDGLFILCHEINNANSVTTTYIGKPDLPIRYEINNDGTGAAANLVCICSTVLSEGGAEDEGLDFSVARGLTDLSAGATTDIFCLLALRRKSGNENITVIPKDVNVLCTSTVSVFYWYLLLNPTVTGTALSYSDVGGGSLMEYDNTADNTTTLSGGTVIQSGVSSSSTFQKVVAEGGEIGHRLGVDLSGVEDFYAIGVQTPAGTAEDFDGTFSWIEQR